VGLFGVFSPFLRFRAKGELSFACAGVSLPGVLPVPGFWVFWAFLACWTFITSCICGAFGIVSVLVLGFPVFCRSGFQDLSSFFVVFFCFFSLACFMSVLLPRFLPSLAGVFELHFEAFS
jgi:hypothetical protein